MRRNTSDSLVLQSASPGIAVANNNEVSNLLQDLKSYEQPRKGERRYTTARFRDLIHIDFFQFSPPVLNKPLGYYACERPLTPSTFFFTSFILLYK